MANEKRLILVDAHKLEELLSECHDVIKSIKPTQLTLMHALLVWMGYCKKPAVDAVEVVRCEDCENAVPFSWAAAGERVQGFRCMKYSGAIGYKCFVFGDDFCASGKRRTENANDLQRGTT